MYYVIDKKTNKVIDKSVTLVLADILAQQWITKGVDATVTDSEGVDLGVETV